MSIANIRGAAAGITGCIAAVLLLLVASAVVLLLLLLLKRAFLTLLSGVPSFITFSSRPRFNRSATALGGATGDCHVGAATATATNVATVSTTL
jgi:hypothetical protein